MVIDTHTPRHRVSRSECRRSRCPIASIHGQTSWELVAEAVRNAASLLGQTRGRIVLLCERLPAGTAASKTIAKTPMLDDEVYAEFSKLADPNVVNLMSIAQVMDSHSIFTLHLIRGQSLISLGIVGIHCGL